MPSLICGLPLYRSTDVSEVRINRLPPEPDCIALCYRPTGKAHGYRHAVLSLPSNFADPLPRTGRMLCKPPFRRNPSGIQVSLIDWEQWAFYHPCHFLVRLLPFHDPTRRPKAHPPKGLQRTVMVWIYTITYIVYTVKWLFSHSYVIYTRSK